MKQFASFTMIKQPLDAVWITMRDRLPTIASELEDLEGIEQLDRTQQADGRLRLVNRWTARRKVPGALQSFLRAERISWIDTAVWDELSHICRWHIDPSVLPGLIECAGQTTYGRAMAGRGTRVTFDGTFEIRSGFLSGAATAFEPAIAGFLETVVATLIPRNLARAVTAAGRLIGGEVRPSADKVGVVEAESRVGEG